MSSHKQFNANRHNSTKSTGPRTEPGKLTSSQNALKTGIYSEAEVIRTESAADLEALANDYHTRFHPDGPEERCFVDILVHSEWILRRLRRAEVQLWERRIEFSVSKFAPPNTDLGGALGYENGEVFSRLQRRIDSTQRNFQRALKDLRHLQDSKPAPAEPAPQPETVPSPVPVPRIQPQPAPSIGFVPSPLPDAPPRLPAPAETAHRRAV